MTECAVRKIKLMNEVSQKQTKSKISELTVHCPYLIQIHTKSKMPSLRIFSDIFVSFHRKQTRYRGLPLQTIYAFPACLAGFLFTAALFEFKRMAAAFAEPEAEAKSLDAADALP